MNTSNISGRTPSRFTLGALACAFSLLAFPAANVQANSNAAGVMVYPAKGQSTSEQEKDKYECHEWAKGQTGFDPASASTPVVVQTGATTSPNASGVVKGAAGGAAVAELANKDTGRGAAIGVLGSGLREQMKQRQSAQTQQYQVAQQQAVRGQQRAGYDRAMAACLEGRGYTVR